MQQEQQVLDRWVMSLAGNALQFNPHLLARVPQDGPWMEAQLDSNNLYGCPLPCHYGPGTASGAISAVQAR